MLALPLDRLSAPCSAGRSIQTAVSLTRVWTAMTLSSSLWAKVRSSRVGTVRTPDQRACMPTPQSPSHCSRFSDGLKGMCIGEKRKLTIPSDLACTRVSARASVARYSFPTSFAHLTAPQMVTVAAARQSLVAQPFNLRWSCWWEAHLSSSAAPKINSSPIRSWLQRLMIH